MPFRSTKTYGHDIGLSCCFRQWRAQSHCALLHGYALSVRLEFEADELDYRNWVIDFGSLKEVKELLQNHFDHKLVVAQDDPDLESLGQLSGLGLADVVVLPAVGCEAFAKWIYGAVYDWLINRTPHGERVFLASVEVAEHGANSAIYLGQDWRQQVKNRNWARNG
ncbi:6-pyruvoyl tetrahydropterin synthase protein [Rhizobium phage RHph_Y55]|nr:6-pyruvoyl tetrahydropterin synthase protein [Rhizobium phage RHph_Y55]